MIVTRNKREKKKAYKKAKGEAHLGKEWDSNCSSSDSDNEGLAATAFNKSSLFPNERHTCLMAKEKKVCTRDNTTYASSSEDESSDDDCRCFETRGVPGPTSELLPSAPAQMGRRKAEREGGREQPEGDRRGRWNPRPSC
jgi:hypothetical protein